MHGDGEAGIPKKSDQNDTRMNKIQNEQHPKQSVNDNIGKFDIQNSLVPQYWIISLPGIDIAGGLPQLEARPSAHSMSISM